METVSREKKTIIKILRETWCLQNKYMVGPVSKAHAAMSDHLWHHIGGRKKMTPASCLLTSYM